jgi:HK97 family phage major capsid protein
MAIRYVERLLTDRDALANQIMAMADKAATEERSLNDSETTVVDKLRGQVTELDNEIRAWNSTSEAFSRFEGLSAPGDEKRADQRAKNGRARTLGQDFVNSAALLEYRGGGTGQRHTAEIGIDEYRGLITVDSLGLAPADFAAAGPTVTSPVLDAIGRVSTNRDSVRILVPGGGAPLAGGPIPEGTVKPEATLGWTSETAEIGTYAHWIPITRQAVSDAPYLRSLVDGELRRGVVNRLETEAALTLTGATGFLTGTGASLDAAIRDGIAEVEAAGFRAETILLNPKDSAAIDISASGSITYADRQRGLWGVNIVTAAAVPQGSAFVGDLRSGITMFDRHIVETFITDSHSDYFIKNVLVLLSEARAGFAVTQPNAVAKCTATVARTAK